MNARRSLRNAAATILLVNTIALAGEPGVRKAEFNTDDGVAIIGDFYPPPGRAVMPAAILLHMYRHDRTSWKPLVRPLQDAGFAVLAIDLRGHGDSTQPKSMRLAQRVIDRDPTLFNAMHKDVAAAVRWLGKQPDIDHATTVLVGASVGCSVAIDYTSRDDNVRVVVCLTPGEKYLGVDSVAHIRKTGTRPILLLATEDEKKATLALASMAGNAQGEIVGPGRVHGTRMFGKIKGVEAKIAEFLQKHAMRTKAKEKSD